MDRGPARRDGRPAVAGAETCGGVMFRGPNSGDGASLSDYSHVIPLFGSAGPGPGVLEHSVLEHEIDPRGSGAPPGRAWSGGRGPSPPWARPGAPWAAPLIVAY